MKKNQLVIYQAKTGAIEVTLDVSRETFLLTQLQIAELFNVQKAAISKHVRNIFSSGELKKATTVSILETVQKEGKREISRSVEYYNLDLVLSIGYRVNSKRATLFRQWATQTLKKHIVDGYTINRSRIANNYDVFMKAVSEVKALLPVGSSADTGSILELITLFADTWVSLDAYDREKFILKGITKKKVQLTAQQLKEALLALKQELLRKGEATELFASSRSASAIESIVGNVMQTFGGKDLYPTIEEKAAHLLYFMVKNHPFVDGNKRSGAFSFVWFLRKTALLNTSRITPAALTSLTLLIAESNPKDKERLTGLVGMLLKK